LKAYVDALCIIPAGTFRMGSTSDFEDEQPVHNVTLSAFWMVASPVTVAIWKEYCSATKLAMPEEPEWDFLDDHPVVNVSWNDIMSVDGKFGFCEWASDISGFRLTLPTEAQFEYAARGGPDGLEFPWGDVFDQSKVWSSETDFGDVGATASVIRSSNIFRNAYGLTDMSGNVWQSCFDLYAPYTTGSQTDPVGPSSTSDNQRCVRGGSWSYYYPVDFRCAYRFWFNPDKRVVNSGFRLSSVAG
jgi:formylglycine-generating enzyme required for sulfatase activity